MTVNAPGDRFEQEADSVAKSVTSTSTPSPVQKAEMPEEELQTNRLQRQGIPEEEELQTKRLQRQEMEDEEMAG